MSITHPSAFYSSTVFIVLSSVTVQLALGGRSQGR